MYFNDYKIELADISISTTIGSSVKDNFKKLYNKFSEWANTHNYRYMYMTSFEMNGYFYAYPKYDSLKFRSGIPSKLMFGTVDSFPNNPIYSYSVSLSSVDASNIYEASIVNSSSIASYANRSNEIVNTSYNWTLKLVLLL